MIQLDPREFPEALQPRYDRVHRRMALRRAWNVLAPCLVACALFAAVLAIGAVAWTFANTATQQQLFQEEPIAP